MKKLTLIVCLGLFIASAAMSQTVNGIPLKELNAKYIRVSEKEVMLTNKISIDIDYGQPLTIRRTRVLAKDGKDMQFNSMIAVLNFMDEIGYELVNGSDSISSFLLKKREPHRQR